MKESKKTRLANSYFHRNAIYYTSFNIRHRDRRHQISSFRFLRITGGLQRQQIRTTGNTGKMSEYRGMEQTKFSPWKSVTKAKLIREYVIECKTSSPWSEHCDKSRLDLTWLDLANSIIYHRVPQHMFVLVSPVRTVFCDALWDYPKLTSPHIVPGKDGEGRGSWQLLWKCQIMSHFLSQKVQSWIVEGWDKKLWHIEMYKDISFDWPLTIVNGVLKPFQWSKSCKPTERTEKTFLRGDLVISMGTCTHPRRSSSRRWD